MSFQYKQDYYGDYVIDGALATTNRPANLIHNTPECITVTKLQGFGIIGKPRTVAISIGFSEFYCGACKRAVTGPSAREVYELYSSSFLSNEGQNAE